VIKPDGQLEPRYFAAPAANMELQRLAAAPASAERYWKMKSSRVSPTRLGTITVSKVVGPLCRSRRGDHVAAERVLRKTA
jgi:hypothetical protein